jgi:hypothetical protein
MFALRRSSRPQLGSTEAAAIPAAHAEALDRRRALAAEQRAFRELPQMHGRFDAHGHWRFARCCRHPKASRA